jgi:hypothetical protein
LIQSIFCFFLRERKLSVGGYSYRKEQQGMQLCDDKNFRRNLLIDFFQCAQLEVWLPDDFDTWPAERQRLWKRVPVDPNAYYYKYPPPGVERKSSNWNARDRMEFIRALQQRPAEGQWGLFSMNFPGRTGQQVCCFMVGLAKFRHFITSYLFSVRRVLCQIARVR